MKYFFAQILYILLIRPWLRFIIGVRFRNRKALDQADQFILVANHNSHFDTLSIMSALPWNKFKKTHSIGDHEYFAKNPFREAAVKFFFNSILIKKVPDADEHTAIYKMNKALKDGKSLVLFPEGTRGKPGVISDFKRGVAVLLKQHPEIPFIPVFLEGFGKVLPKTKTLIIPLNCSVRFGRPLYPKSNEIPEILEEVKREVMALEKRDERLSHDFEKI